MSPQLCGTPTGLLCIMRCAWCASSRLILFFRTQNSSTRPFVTRAKASGEKREFTHHFSCVSHNLTGVRKYLAPYIWKKLLFFFPQVSLCHGTRSTVLIFSSANGTWSVSRARAIGKPKPSIRGRDTAPLGSLAFGNLETVQLHVLSCCRLWWSVLQRAQHKDRSCISASCFLAGIQAGFI